MTPKQLDALMDFLQAVMSFINKHGSTNEQIRILEEWQQLYGVMLGDG